MYGSVPGNLLGLLFFLLFEVCGSLWAFALLPGESRGAKLLIGSVFGTVSLQWFPVLFAFFFGFTLWSHLLGLSLALLLGLATCLFLWRHKARRGVLRQREKPVFLRRKFFWVVFSVWLFFCVLVWRSFLFREGRIYSSQATYGDMSMHLSFITSLSRQGTFPPDYSILPGVRLSYPFLSDSISSSLYLLGASLKLAYTFPMWAAGAQVLFGCWLFFRRLLKGHEGKAALAWSFFFFNGGLGVFYFLGAGKDGFLRIFRELYQTPTNFTEKGIRWVNVIADMMLPQRATLFGWAVLFPLLYLLCRAVFEKKRRYFLISGVVSGLLPMIHTHSFLSFALVCGTWMLCSLLSSLSWAEKAEKIGKWAAAGGLVSLWIGKHLLDFFHQRSGAFLLILALLFLAAGAGGLFFLLWQSRRRGEKVFPSWGLLFFSACLFAVPQLLYWTFRQAGPGGFVRGHFGWSMGEEDYLWFYLKNIGPAAVLAFLGLIFAKQGNFMRWAPGPVIWLIAELVVFQPNEYDNNKLLYPAFLFFCCAASEYAFSLFEKLKKGLPRQGAAALTALLCSVSASLTLGREFVSRYELYGTGALTLCSYIEKNLPSDALVLTDTRHNNEVASLTGRNILCGSPSYLFFHGLDYWEKEEAVKAMYETPKASFQLFSRFQVGYILVSDFERNSYQVDEKALGELFPLIYHDGNRKLYQVTEKKQR